MRIIAKRTLRDFWEKNPQAQAPLEVWFRIISKADWKGPADVRAAFRSADFVGDNRVIFDILNNRFRLIAHIAYRHHTVLVKFVGTHAEYNRINPEDV
ncbi:type II toxin-antitoxin system HigB family toxin [Roseomonas chloroacetimidivorans]|uniref:type II toxin-antitoxin system HigB family toxin n=1 Tax=Roseomonas chloroacetimidivorans TaxID=1766656 RepID=UPI003C781329